LFDVAVCLRSYNGEVSSQKQSEHYRRSVGTTAQHAKQARDQGCSGNQHPRHENNVAGGVHIATIEKQRYENRLLKRPETSTLSIA
jgi:hypothetical protein